MTAPRRRWSFSLRTLFVVVTMVGTLIVAVPAAYERFRPLSFDDHGIPHGSGERIRKYTSGAIMARANYVSGQLVYSVWFKPDGTTIQETHWLRGSGEGIYLRDDGSIRRRIQYVNGFAEGKCINYDENGVTTAVEWFHDGQPIDAPAN